MDSSEARDYTRMLDGILRSTDRTVRMHPSLLISIGGMAATITGLIQARQMGFAIPPDQHIQPVAWLVTLAVIAVTTWNRGRPERETLVDSYAGTVFLVVFAVALTLNLTAQHRTVSAAGMGLFWAAGFSAALMIVGAMGSRALLAGGLAMLAVTAGASLVPGWLPGFLALAWFVGFVVPGIILAIGGRGGRTPAV